MQFWQSGAVLTALAIAALLVGCELLARVLPGLRRLGLPLSIIAGVVGLLIGDQVLGLISLDGAVLQSIVYHGLALVFIAVGLEAPTEGSGGGKSSLSMGFAIVAIMASQAALGLGVVLVLDASLHPGFGLLLPMGFEEGPGQALSIGAAWEQSGLPSGAQVGLIVAVLGYAWSILGGVPLAIWARRKGWVARPSEPAQIGVRGEQTISVATPEPGSLDSLSVQLGLIGVCYLLTWGACTLLAGALAFDPEVAAVVWGIHFIIGAGIAVVVRLLLARLPGGTPVDSHLMRRAGGLGVDVITCAALAAVELAVLQSHWLPLLLVTSLGGLWTLVFSVWLARRAWTEAPFEHALLFYGMSTGTLPTGLTLLKMVDPELRSPAPISAVFGSLGAVIGGALLILGCFPIIIKGFAADWPARGWLMLGVLLGITVVVFVLWRLFGGLRFRRPLLSPWPALDVDQGPESL